MNVLQGLDGLRRVPPGSVVSIGNFDGLHLGHRHILATARALASDLSSSASSGRVAVVTFEPHPITVLRPGHEPPRLTPPALKQELLAAAGVDEYVVLPPVPEVLNLTAEQFWAVLRDDARPAHLVEGHTFTFGKNRGGTIDRLREWTAGTGCQLHVVNPVRVPLLGLQVVAVSSSLVRWLVDQGRVRDAAICLGRPYALQGEVVQGHRRGRTIGMPTANLHCGDQLVPADGVYAARCAVGGAAYPVALSIGTMPTFGDGYTRQVEAHLIGFAGDLYGQTLRVEVLDWLREQWKFKGLDALKARMAGDLDETRARQTLSPERAVVQL